MSTPAATSDAEVRPRAGYASVEDADCFGRASADQLWRLHLAVLSMGTDLELAVVARRIVDAATDLVDARYGALSVLDTHRTLLTGCATSGTRPQAARVADPEDHPDRFVRVAAGPLTTSFLRVTVRVEDQAHALLYVSHKRDGHAFTDVDEALTTALAAAAGMAIGKARLNARLRRAAVIEDRDRIARSLHNSVVSRLFGVGLSLQGALQLLDAEPDAGGRIDRAIDELDQIASEVRSTVFELRVEVGVGGGSVTDSSSSVIR